MGIGSETLEEHLRRIAAMEHVSDFRLEHALDWVVEGPKWCWSATVRGMPYGNSLVATEPIRNLTMHAVETLRRLGDQSDDV